MLIMDQAQDVVAPPADTAARCRQYLQNAQRPASDTVGDVTADAPLICARNVNVHYGDKHAIREVNIDIARNQVLAMIGPSGCGKSTFLRCINRMNDTIEGARITGNIRARRPGHLRPQAGRGELRARIGMVFQKPNPFPKTIYENVAYGPRIHGLAANRVELDEIVYEQPAAGRPVGRGEGPAFKPGHQPVRWPAAAAVHRAHDRRESGSDPDG
jgi:phosphate transport system ATP-binding protein